MAVNIFYNYSAFPTPSQNRIIDLAKYLLQQENRKTGRINIIFTDNKEIFSLNAQYLNHHYYTDVIAFYYSKSGPVEGDIFISLDKVDENSKTYNAGFENELIRVIVHGLLHLIGYTDTSEQEKERMHHLEDQYIEHYNLNFR